MIALTVGAEADADPDRFSSDWWQDVLLGNPLKVTVLVVIAVITRYVLHKIIDRLVNRMSAVEPPKRVFGSVSAANLVAAGAGHSERRALRTRTLGSMLKSVVTAVIGALTTVMILDIVGYDIAPLIASAGIVGIALGFGAQNLVKDFISGLSMLLEDQYGVGDVIDMGEATGTVEAVGMRVTRLRSTDGTVWYVRNGEIIRVGNMSQDWARAIVDVRVAYDEDLDRVGGIMADTAQGLFEDPDWSAKLLEPPEVSGVESLGTDAVVMRVTVKTTAPERWAVARELRARIKDAFDAEGIEIPQTATVPPPTA